MPGPVNGLPNHRRTAAADLAPRPFTRRTWPCATTVAFAASVNASRCSGCAVAGHSTITRRAPRSCNQRSNARTVAGDPLAFTTNACWPSSPNRYVTNARGRSSTTVCHPVRRSNQGNRSALWRVPGQSRFHAARTQAMSRRGSNGRGLVAGVLVPNTEFGHLTLRGKDAETIASAKAREVNDWSWKKWSKRVREYLHLVDRLINPDLIIVGGGVSQRAEKWLPRASKGVKAKVVPAKLHNEAGIVGAAMAAAKGG